jgi:hypothetical protein
MSETRSRYPFLAMGNLLAGGFLLVAVFAWAAATTAWLGFAISIPLLLFGLAMAYSALRGGAAVGERIGVTTLGLLTSVIAAWTIIASLVRAVDRALADLRQRLCPRDALDGQPGDPRDHHRAGRPPSRRWRARVARRALGRVPNRRAGRARRPARRPASRG